jgi:hypothetical protein
MILPLHQFTGAAARLASMEIMIDLETG